MSYLQMAKDWEAKRKAQKKEPAQVFDFAYEAKKIRAALYRHGLVKIKSETLGEEVYWARDSREAVRVTAGAIVYTLDELRELARGNPTREGLRQMHQAKKIFGGTVQAGASPWEKKGS